MATVSNEYQKYVLDDLKDYAGLGHPVKSNFIARTFVKNLEISKLHPNPDDEFSVPEIGPNDTIISNYESYFRRMMLHGMNPFDDPVYVTRLSTGGYLILNGHHRWYAAHRTSMNKLPVKLVNVTPAESIIAAVNRSGKNMCASFDLDEVLFTDGVSSPAERDLPFPLKNIYPQRLRKNATVLIHELQSLGCDIWVYTGDFYSDLYLKLFFMLHGIHIDGIISGKMSSKVRKVIQNAFAEKYNYSLHIDNDGVLCVNTKTKEYETVDFPKDDNVWAVEAYTTLRDIELLKGTSHGAVSE